MQADPDSIRVLDKFGRQVVIPREEWRTRVLPLNLESQWNDADGLYGVIVQSLNDGFHADVLKAAEQLYRIDTHADRAAAILGIVYMKNERYADAEKILRGYIATHGEDGAILTNLAKVQWGQGDRATAEATLWHALEADPNFDNGMGWFYSIHKERGGEAAALAALRQVAALKGSWRAQTWLAREDVEKGRIEPALALYRDALQRSGKPVPPDLLEQMSGDLGKAGKLNELVALTEPNFDPETHGIWVGNNLIKAHLDLGRIDRARDLLNRLYALKRPDWQDTLRYWDTAIAEADVSQMPAPAAEGMQIAMRTFEGPIWLAPGSAGTELFPQTSAGSVCVAFLGSSAEVPDAPQQIERQMADARGRLSRALPMFLAEQASLNSNTNARILVPWLQDAHAQGFVLSGNPWNDKTACGYARQGDPPCGFVVTTHLKTGNEPWQAELRLIRTEDTACIGTANAAFASGKPESAVPVLARTLVTLLAEKSGVSPSPAPAAYRTPEGAQFADYLLRLEQLLAVRCASGGGAMKNTLSGEREILDGTIQLCLDTPRNPLTRLLLAKTVEAMTLVRPDIMPEFEDKLAALQKDRPLPEPAQSVMRKILAAALASPSP